MILLRTGVVPRSPADSGTTINVHGELLNNTGLAKQAHVVVVNIENYPVVPLVEVTVDVQAGCWSFFNAFVPGDLDHWEVRIFLPDDGMLATIYHFVNSVRRDDSLTYRSTELVKQITGSLVDLPEIGHADGDQATEAQAGSGETGTPVEKAVEQRLR